MMQVFSLFLVVDVVHSSPLSCSIVSTCPLIFYFRFLNRASALSRFGVIYIMTHDSIGLGEDGPTHQPVEVMELLRATPNMYAFRPADGNEVRLCVRQ